MIQKLAVIFILATILNACTSINKYKHNPEERVIVGNIKVIDLRDDKKPKDVTEHCNVYFNSKTYSYSLDKSGRVAHSVTNDLVKISRITCYPNKLGIGAIERDFKYHTLKFQQTKNKVGTTYFGDLVIVMGNTSINADWKLLALDFSLGLLSGGLAANSYSNSITINSNWNYRTQNNLIKTQTWLKKLDNQRTKVHTSIISTQL